MLSLVALCGLMMTAEPAGPAAPNRVTKPKVQGWASKRVVERIDRGLVAVPMPENRVYLSWRLLADDPKDAAFNVYRSTSNAQPVRINSEPISRTTDYTDASAPAGEALAYTVRRVADGKEDAASTAARVPAGARPTGCLSLKLKGNRTFQKVGLADLNGDGVFDFVIKQPLDNIDPYIKYWKRASETYKIEAYLSDGTFLWRNDLGWSIERGIWYSPYLVYDFDGDGKAEVAVKTGEGDPRDPDGRVTSGPEYLSIWDGMTGKEITRVDWPTREGFTGDREGAYNYYCRNQIGLAFLDGKTPCLIVNRGTYNTIKVVAYEYQNRQLRELWRWTNSEDGPLYRGQGAHLIHCADIDEDGRDEVILGSAVLDDNGNGLWSTGFGHPDFLYVGDVDPSRPGLEIYYGIEPGRPSNAMCLVEARTGKLIWGLNERTYHIHASGLCADFDPNHPGMECYGGEAEKEPRGQNRRWLFSAKGELMADQKTCRWAKDLSPRAVYWDADPYRELVIAQAIQTYAGKKYVEKVEGAQVLWGDVLGDWREEIITSLPGELRIYVSTIPAADRRVCLMQDPIHRIDVAHLSMGYPQPPMTSFCISAGR